MAITMNRISLNQIITNLIGDTKLKSVNLEVDNNKLSIGSLAFA